MPIDVNDLFFSYSKKINKNIQYVLKDITFKFDKKDILAIVGKTGSGKSTLIQTLNGLERPFSGKIEVDDYILDFSLQYKKDGSINYRKMKKRHNKKIKDINSLRKRVGVVFQFPEYQLFESTVYEDVSYGVKKFYTKDDVDTMTKEALSLVDIPSSYYEKSPFELSGGEKRRVALAGILAFKPDYLILDEPTVGLDSSGKENLIDILLKLHDKGVGIILVTHDMNTLLTLATRVLFIEEGKVIKDVTPVELFSDKEFVKENDIEVPLPIKSALYLKEKDIHIDLNKIKDISTLVLEMKRCLK